MDSALQRRAARLVEREVHACMSSLVATLAAGSITIERTSRMDGRVARAAMVDLCEQAHELAAPVLDYEGAARSAGWRSYGDANQFPIHYGPGDASDTEDDLREATDWQDACRIDDIEPHGLEVFEHWAVSQWLAEKLIEQGERVDTDFAGLNVWARTTTGQAIGADSVIEKITEATGYASGGAVKGGADV